MSLARLRHALLPNVQRVWAAGCVPSAPSVCQYQFSSSAGNATSEKPQSSSKPAPASSLAEQPEASTSQPSWESAKASQATGWLRGPEAYTTLVDDEWVEWIDPQTGEKCWRSIVTGETTVPGIPKPETWTEVVDKQTGLLYYWNRRTGEVTNLGEPRPGPYGRVAAQGVSEEDLADTKRRFLKKEGDPTILSLYNTPLGYVLIAIAAIGALVPYLLSLKG